MLRREKSQCADAVGAPASGITRRDALRASGAGIALLMTPALLSACGSDEDTDGGATISGPVISGQSFAPTTFDPHVVSDIAGIVVVMHTHEGLYGKAVEPPFAVRPELAVGEPEELTPTRLRVRLRSGATFHDGAPVTPKDVAASFARVLNPDLGSLQLGFLAAVKSVQADGEDAVVVNLNFPTALIKDRLALVKVIPAARAKEKAGAGVFNTKPLGSGPYELTSGTTNLRTVRFTRFADYNGPIEASLDRIGFDVMLDDQARVAALQTKRLAAMVDPPFSAIDRLGDGSGIDAGGILSFQQSLIIFNNAKKPFDDNRVRRAILHAIDRDVITKSVFFGHAEAATSYLPRTNPDYKLPAAPLEYDPEKARALLAEAGVPDLSFQLNVSNLGWLAPQAPIVQSQLQDVGITTKLFQGETESLVKYVIDGSYDVWLTVTDPSVFGNSDAQFLIQWIYGSLAGFMHWTDAASKRMASLLERALRSTSKDELGELLGEMQDLIAEEAPAFPLHHREAIAAWSTGLDLAVDPVYGVDLRRAKLAA